MTISALQKISWGKVKNHHCFVDSKTSIETLTRKSRKDCGKAIYMLGNYIQKLNTQNHMKQVDLKAQLMKKIEIFEKQNTAMHEVLKFLKEFHTKL